jgi:streptogramin lyase
MTRRPARLSVEPLEDRVVPHSGATQFTAGITAGAAPAGIVFGPDSNFWFTEFAASKVARITRAGVVTEFALPAGRGPLYITEGPDGNIWFTENTGDRIGRLNPKAGDDAAIQASIAEFAVPGARSLPIDIATGPDGALWFTEAGSDQIGRITTAGTITEFAVPGAGSAPAGITAGADGNLWFTEAGSGQIGRLTTAGAFTEFSIPVVANGVSDPEDITLGPGGNLFFTDFGRDQIGRITPSGEFTHFDLPVGRGPHDIVADPDGELYFTMAASGRIGRLPASALATGRPTSGEPPLEEFDFIPAVSTPLGLALDDNKDIFFTLNAGNAVAFFQAHLLQITVAVTGSEARFYDTHLNEVRRVTPFPGFTGTISVAVQEVSGNGVPDAIFGAGPGGSPHVKVFDGADGTLVANFFAFEPAATGGITLGADDVNGDGRADIIVASGTRVKVIDGFKLGQVGPDGIILDSALLANFFAFPFGTVTSITLAAGDLNRDGHAEVVVGAGPGGAAHVKVIDGTKLGLTGAGGVIADGALLASFFAFDPSFRNGVNVGVGINGDRRDVLVGAGPGGGPHVKFIDGTKLGQVGADGQIAPAALLASFFAFAPNFTGGVRVAADDLNSDGLTDIIVTPGPGGGPNIRVIDGAKLSQLLPTGEVAPGALLGSFFTGDPGFTGGVFIGADADHRDGPVFGPPGVNAATSRRDINDVFLFQSPANAANTVMSMDVSPFSTATTSNSFEPGVLFDFRVINRDLLAATDDLTFRVTFGPLGADGKQDVELRALPAARFPGAGGVLVKGLTGTNLAVRGAGGTGAQFRAAEQDDPFFFDASGFNSTTNPKALLNHNTAVDAVVAGDYPRGTGSPGPNGEPFFAPGGNPNYDAPNFFARANTLSMVLEIPSAAITGPAIDAVSNTPVIGLWGRTEFGGVQFDRMGRPAINTALIPPVPRGANFPANGSTANRQDVRTAFNLGHPRDDRANFADDVAGVLAAFYPAGRPTNGANPAQDMAQAQIVASLLMPDILVYRPSSSAGFFGDTVGTLGQSNFFLAGGRKLSDNIIDTEIQILTDADTPFNLDGGVNQPPALMTENVRDDNGQNLFDGSIDKPLAQGGGGTGQRPIAFPYYGSPNSGPSGAP